MPICGAQRVERQLAHVGAVQQHAAPVDVVEARDQGGEGGLAAAGGPDQRDRLAGRDLEVDLRQHRPLAVVAEPDLLEPQHAGTDRQRARVRPLDDVALLVEHLEHALAGRHRALVLADPHPDRPQRQHQQRQVRVHGEELAQRQLAVHDLVAAHQHHPGDRDAGQRRHGRHVGGLQSGCAQRLAKDPLRPRPEPIRLVLLLRERLHHAHAHDVLLGAGGDVGDPLLDLLQHGVADPRVPVGHVGQHRRDRERDQRQLHADQRHHHQHADHGEHVLGEEDQAVAEEHPHRLHVDRGPRHQLPGLMPVEEAVGEPLHVAVHAVAQVVLDGQ